MAKPMTKTQLVAALAEDMGDRQEIRRRGTGRNVRPDHT